MSRVRSKDTGLEKAVRRQLWALGYRYRLHRKSLPGTPDIVFPARKKAVFVHGCFWHHHPRCGRTPKTRLDFWTPKLSANRARDLKNQRALRALGWEFRIVWECELKDPHAVSRRLTRFLEGTERGA